MALNYKLIKNQEHPVQKRKCLSSLTDRGYFMRKGKAWNEIFAGDKRTSLLQKFINNDRKSFMTSSQTRQSKE
jgi:hypothetical protein